MNPNRQTRRQFLFGWFPFFWRLFHRERYVTLGSIRLEVIRHGHSALRYLLIHGNEETARQVLLEHMKARPGVAYLAAGHSRYVRIDSGRLDPNRMFSREGAERNLRLLNPNWTPERLHKVLDQLDRGRPKLLHSLMPPPGGLIIALHNNSPGYSVRDEIPISDKTSIQDPEHPHDFFLCTDPDDFAVLATSPYNVVLQDRAPKEDDGSLSRFVAHRGGRYINLEVELGKREKQKEMLIWLEMQVLKRRDVPVT